MGDWGWPFEVQIGTPSLITLSQKQIIITDLCGYTGYNHRLSLSIQIWWSGGGTLSNLLSKKSRQYDQFFYTNDQHWYYDWAHGSYFLEIKNPVERHSLSINLFSEASQN